jgi:hypothetical protein
VTIAAPAPVWPPLLTARRLPDPDSDPCASFKQAREVVDKYNEQFEQVSGKTSSLVEILSSRVPMDGAKDECTCMKEEDGSVETPSGSCPVHGWMVDEHKAALDGPRPARVRASRGVNFAPVPLLDPSGHLAEILGILLQALKGRAGPRAGSRRCRGHLVGVGRYRRAAPRSWMPWKPRRGS